MSCSTLFTPGTSVIDDRYLPPTHSITPQTFAQILTTSDDAGGNDITNLGRITSNDNYLILNSTTSSNLGQLHIDSANTSFQLFQDSQNNLQYGCFLTNPSSHWTFMTMNKSTGATVIGDGSLSGSQLYINGKNGLSKPYDAVYNPIPSSIVNIPTEYVQDYAVATSPINMPPYPNSIINPSGNLYIMVYNFPNLLSYPGCCNFSASVEAISMDMQGYIDGTRLTLTFYLVDVPNIASMTSADLLKCVRSYTSVITVNNETGSTLSFQFFTLQWKYSSHPSSLKLIAYVSALNNNNSQYLSKTLVDFTCTANTIKTIVLPQQTV